MYIELWLALSSLSEEQCQLCRRGERQTGVSTIADVSSVSPSLGRHSLWRRANARNVNHCLFHGVHYLHQHTVDSPVWNVAHILAVSVYIVWCGIEAWSNNLQNVTHHHSIGCKNLHDIDVTLSLLFVQVFQEDLEKQQLEVNSLTHMVVVVDDNAPDSASADLEEQLAVLGERWAAVCRWAEQRSELCLGGEGWGLHKASKNIGTSQTSCALSGQEF